MRARSDLKTIRRFYPTLRIGCAERYVWEIVAAKIPFYACAIFVGMAESADRIMAA
jgi:hypothetical protein